MTPYEAPKERRCQVTFGKLEDEVPGVPNEAATGLEQPQPVSRRRADRQEDNGLRVARKLRRPAERAAGRINGGEDGAVRAGGGG